MSRSPSRTPTPATRAAERTGRKNPNVYEFLRIYQHVIERFGERGLDLLDYGCGSGYGADLVAGHFNRVAGVDVYQAAVEDCRSAYSRPNLEFKLLEPPDPPYADESFDVITSFQVVEHVPETQLGAYFTGIWRMLKPGGTAIITTPNGRNYFGGHSTNPHHVREWDATTFREVVTRYWPAQQTSFRAQRDVLSTTVGIRIRRAFHGHRLAWPAARVVVGPLRVMERSGLIDVDRRRLFNETDFDATVGGLYAETSKAASS